MEYDYSIELTERTGGCKYKVQLLDADAVPITEDRVTSLTLTLRDVKSDSIINTRDHQDASDMLGSLGWLTWTMVPADNVIVATSNVPAQEEHEATFTVKADAGAVELSWVVQILVRSLVKVP